MKQAKIFLTAEWRNIIMFNYEVDPAILERLVPAGTTLDTFEGKTWVSLVGFEFNRTRILGLRIPFHQAFPEVNLRFYVQGPAGRGVVFIRELVPKTAVAFVARFVFGENYSCVPMSCRTEKLADGDIAAAEYSWGSGPDLCSMRLDTEEAGSLPSEGSLAQFITEHYWGYSRQRDGGSLEYEVQHARWPVQQSKKAALYGNPTRFYGDKLAQVFMRAPDSAFLIKGSPVTVFRGRPVRSLL